MPIRRSAENSFAKSKRPTGVTAPSASIFSRKGEDSLEQIKYINSRPTDHERAIAAVSLGLGQNQQCGLAIIRVVLSLQAHRARDIFGWLSEKP
ncbi:MAG TPA: hypothetical protein VHW24_16475, partial [Bryobacteraceae bacterium]|nr:hypothetical protein [Bryobacteraceae bacterium]